MAALLLVLLVTNPHIVAPPPPPAAPTHVRFVMVTSTTARLQWSHDRELASFFRVYVSYGGPQRRLLVETRSLSTLVEATRAMTTLFWVTAVGQGGESGLSNSVAIAPTAKRRALRAAPHLVYPPMRPPEAPTNLRLAERTSTTARLEWSHDMRGTDRFWVYASYRREPQARVVADTSATGAEVGIIPGARAEFFVTAVGPVGESRASEVLVIEPTAKRRAVR